MDHFRNSHRSLMTTRGYLTENGQLFNINLIDFSEKTYLTVRLFRLKRTVLRRIIKQNYTIICSC